MDTPNNILYLIPARGGSKGIPNKNIAPIDGKPLIYYTITEALKIADPADICLSTDSPKIKEVAESMGLPVPFLRPDELSGDKSTSEEVILHALDYYQQNGRQYDFVVMLQPTSPLRKVDHIRDAITKVTSTTELIVSVKETDANPYYVLFEEENNVLHKCKKGTFTRRQDCPVVYELNGAVYVIRVRSLLEKGYQQLQMTKSIMPKDASIDIDHPLDLKIAELILKETR